MRWAWAALALLWGGVAMAETLVTYSVVDDAVVRPLTTRRGNPERGLGIMESRDAGNCMLCHTMPLRGRHVFGNAGPDLAGVGARLSEGQLRLRVIDQSKLNAKTIMPAYYRIDGLTRVATAYRNKPILTAQQVEDVVAFLMTLRP